MAYVKDFLSLHHQGTKWAVLLYLSCLIILNRSTVHRKYNVALKLLIICQTNKQWRQWPPDSPCVANGHHWPTSTGCRRHYGRKYNSKKCNIDLCLMTMVIVSFISKVIACYSCLKSVIQHAAVQQRTKLYYFSSLYYFYYLLFLYSRLFHLCNIVKSENRNSNHCSWGWGCVCICLVE